MVNNENSSRWLASGDAAGRLGVDIDRVRSLCRVGFLAWRFGGQWLEISRWSIERLEQQGWPWEEEEDASR